MAKEAIGALPGLDWNQVAGDAAGHVARGQVSKFQPCLPQDAEDLLLAEKLLDVAGTTAFLATAPARAGN